MTTQANEHTLIMDGREYPLCIFAFAPSKATGRHMALLDNSRITEYTHAWGLEHFTQAEIDELIKRQTECTSDLQVLGRGVIWRIDGVLQGRDVK